MLAWPKTHPRKKSPGISAKDRDLENLLRLASIYRKSAGDLCRLMQTEGEVRKRYGAFF
jgi:hypothetical protein